VEKRSMVGPMPRQLERPQQRDYLLHIPRSGKHQICVEEHDEKHSKEKDQKAATKSLAFHPTGDVLFPRQTQTASEQAEELSPAAIPVTVSLRSPDERDRKRDKETQQAQPGIEYVEKT